MQADAAWLLQAGQCSSGCSVSRLCAWCGSNMFRTSDGERLSGSILAEVSAQIGVTFGVGRALKITAPWNLALPTLPACENLIITQASTSIAPLPRSVTLSSPYRQFPSSITSRCSLDSRKTPIQLPRQNLPLGQSRLLSSSTDIFSRGADPRFLPSHIRSRATHYRQQLHPPTRKEPLVGRHDVCNQGLAAGRCPRRATTVN